MFLIKVIGNVYRTGKISVEKKYNLLDLITPQDTALSITLSVNVMDRCCMVHTNASLCGRAAMFIILNERLNNIEHFLYLHFVKINNKSETMIIFSGRARAPSIIYSYWFTSISLGLIDFIHWLLQFPFIHLLNQLRAARPHSHRHEMRTVRNEYCHIFWWNKLHRLIIIGSVFTTHFIVLFCYFKYGPSVRQFRSP